MSTLTAPYGAESRDLLSKFRFISRSSAVVAGAVLAVGFIQPVTAFPDAQAGPPPDQQLALTQYVDLLIGTAIPSSSGYMGNVAPGAQVPFGMVNFGPDMPRTDYNGSGGSVIKPPTSATGNINFFSVTHLNGPGCPGAGVVGMMPSSTPRAILNTSNGRPQAVAFQTATEQASPGYYKVALNNQVGVEFTSTTRTGMARFTYPDADSGYYALDTKINGTSNLNSTAGKISASNVELTVSADGKVLSGKTVAPAFCTPWGTKYTSNVYFYAEFDKALRAQAEGSTVNTVTGGATVLQYDLTEADPTLTMKVGISSVSLANAKLNLDTENPNSTFDQVRAASQSEWNSRLNSVQIDQAANPDSLTADQRTNLTKFYTALYRVFVSPTTYSDVNGDYRSMKASRPFPSGVDTVGNVEQRPIENVANDSFTRPDGTTRTPAVHYSGLSMWDTYRSAAQALTLFAPDVANDVMQSLVADGEQCGAFPHWVDASDDSTPMAGDNALAVLAATYSFGATDFDLKAAARLVKQSVFDPTSNCNGNTSISNAQRYLDYGYRTGSEAGQPVSASIEQYAGDHAAAVFLSSVPTSVLEDPEVNITPEDIAKLNDRSSWWKNLLDYDLGTLRPRNAPTVPGVPGTWANHSDPFHESTEPNYFWSFGYAWPDLIEAIGERPAVERLNRLFSIDDELTRVPTIRELNGGQSSQGFYIGNEPALPAPWAYNYAGAPASTQYIVQQIMRTAFSTARDGLPGNDDYGATSSWYVFAGLGLFPVSQAEGGLALSTPQFPAMTVWFGDTALRIVNSADPAQTPFIRSLDIDSRPQDRSWLPLGALLNGSNSHQLQYTLSPTATPWATALSPRQAGTSTVSLLLSEGDHYVGTPTPTTVTAAVTFSDAISQPGTVEIKLGADVLTSAPLGKGGAVTASIPADLPVGQYSLTATFVPSDPGRTTGSASSAQPFTVEPLATDADLAVLRVAIQVASLFEAQQDRYTPESYVRLGDALIEARALLTADPLLAKQVNEAIDELLAAQDALVDGVDTSVLEALIAEANAILDNPGGYVGTEQAALAAAVAAAEALLASDPTQLQVTESAITLSTALAKVHPKGDKTILIALIAVVEGLNSSQFTPSTWLPVRAAVTGGEAVRDNAEASVDDVDGAVAEIQAALSALVLRAAKAGLGSAIGLGEVILENAEQYVPASLSGLPEALTAAQAVYADDDATSAEVSAAQAALIAKIATVRVKPVTGGSPSAAPASVAEVLLSPAAAATVALAPQGVEESVAVEQQASVALKSFTKTAKPKIAGVAAVGKKLTAKAGAWSPKAELSYQWYRGGKKIAKATTSTYTVRSADLGKKITVKVTAKKAGFTTTTTVSKARVAK
ncbi:MAG: glycoside hydrolase family 92 protein [Bifidobacteriaceae bacterium]|jgi:putative alpha-1,2-mannosidase|nr:glycoside hydrolase family 92 protein [Bifidobacteriaceae bacterium]